MNKGSFLALRLASCAIVLCVSFLHTFSFAQSTGSSDWTDISLSGTDAFSIDAEYRYKVSSQSNFWLYPKEVSARSLVSNESYFGQIFYVSADAKTSYQYNGNFLGTVVQIQKRVLPPWTDVSLTGTDPFDLTHEYRFKMTVPGRPGVPAGDFWYYAKQVGAQSLVMDNGYGEITFVSAANKAAYLSRGTPTGIIISQMQRRALTWDDVPLNTTEAYDVSCNYRFKMNYPASPQWRPGVPAGDFWHYPERTSAQSHIANANGGYQTFSVFANNKAVFDFNGVNNGAVLQMQKQCNVPPSLAPTCGNPRAKVTFGTYDPAITGNSGANAWTSLTLGNKVIIPENQFFDIKDGTYAIDDGTIVSTGLQNFAVSRHDGYIEFLAIGRRLPAYYGYYEGTITFENVQVDRVEGGLTTATWADIGLEASENDVVTKVSDSKVSFKLAFANQGDGFRVYLKNPTPTPCNCPTGETKVPDPKSPVCIVRALVKGVQDTDFILTGYNHLVGNCTLAAGTPQPPQAPSSQITVTAGQQRTSWLQGSPWPSQLDSLLTCPSGTTKTACSFTLGSGALGEITCGCYPNESTTTPKNLSCRTFSDPLVHGRPIFSRDATPAQFCREQGYTHSATVITEYDYLNNGSLWNGSVWEINNHLAAIHEVSCCKLEDKAADICAPATCPGTPTLKNGSSLTNVLNPQGEAFSTNAQCAGKQISLAPCSSTTGVLSTGTSPDGNKLYLWPKAASGLSQDYNLVDIKGQCWFADNLQENPSLWPSPIGTWENTAPHNGYGRYDFGTTLAGARAEGYLYQFDSGTNNSAAGGAPAERLQGVCPTGWHVATDCEFQFVEHISGMTIAEQQLTGVRSSGAVGNDLKTGGSSGFDMPFSGARRYNTGFINGGSEGHLWSSECSATGCYKRILNNTNGSITRLQGDGGTYDASHHAAGSIRCVKDGTTAVSNTCNTTCQAGEYWCNAENACKPAGQSCGTLTCNNNNICEPGESCNCGDCTNGGVDDKDRCGFSNSSQMVCTKDIQNTTTAGVFNSATAQANFDIVNGKLATYLNSPGNLNVSAGEFGSAATELKITQNDWKNTSGSFIAFTSFTKEEAWTRAKELLAIPASAQILWSQTSVKYENDVIGDNERYLYSYVIQQAAGVQKQIFFATEFLPGYGWRKVYTVSKDYPLSTTPTGAEVCQNFVNPVLFGKPLASYRSPAQFCLEQGFRGTSTIINDTGITGWITQWNASGTGWESNENGDKINEIRCCGVPSNATTGTIQVGACCPVGTQWSSTANACVTDKCGEGQYYCHEELKCKPANEPCSAVICEDKVVFNYTGAVQNYTVPADVKKIQVKAWGAAGGSGSAPWLYIGAAGGYVQGEMPVNAGEQYKIVVGEGGKKASTLMTFGGGGAGTPYWGGSGGGLSGIFKNSFTHANSLLIAGGGSGASGGGNQNSEGFGGGLSGGYRTTDGYGGQHPMPGTQTAGGVSVAPYSSALKGGDGGPLNGGNGSMTYCGDGGAGGGGGGYYGGSGGVGDWCTFPSAGDTEGAGGSGYIHASVVNGQFMTATSTDPKTAPKKIDADYVTGVAEGKNTGDASGGNGLVVITECRPKPTATCNNNGLCDTNESCNCADCNDKVDHCAINGTGEQLICTKDTTPPCFADKFPYCFPACLDGYTRDASGQCVAVTALPTESLSCALRASYGTELTIVQCNAGETRVGGGCANYGVRGAPGDYGGGMFSGANFPIAKGQILLGYGAPSQDGWACATGSTGAYARAFATCCTGVGEGTTTIRKSAPGSIVAQVECNAGETRIGGGCENTAGVVAGYWNYPMSAGEDPLGTYAPTATRDGWVCHTGASENMVVAYALCRTSTGDSPLKNITVKKGTSAGEAVSCDAGQKLIGGGYANNSVGGAYAWVSLPIYTGVSIHNIYNDSYIYTATKDEYFAISGSPGMSLTVYAICASTATATATTTGSQNFNYPVKIDGYVKNDAASATKFCTEKGFTSAMIVSSDSSGARKMGWNGTSWVADNSGGSYVKLLTCSGGTSQNYTCKAYTGNIQTHGGYLSIQPQSTTQFCKEAGYDFPQLISQYSTSSSCRLWNGTSWYENTACVAASGLKCCNNPPPVVPATPSSIVQTGACCPPGSAWNSSENRCVPSTCGVGQFYCAAQKKCLPGGTTCDTTVCNNNGICEGEESCQCGDCVDGPTQTDPAKKADDKDKCSIIEGVQAMCSDDIPTDNKPGACCLPPQTWNSATGTCMECSNTQAPSELKAGVDQPYISCTGNGDTTQTHFKYRLTKTSGTSAAAFTSATPVSVGTQVLHTATPFTEGTYKVECFYGTATNVPTDSLSTPHTCTKNIQVKTGNVQGCDTIITHKDSLLTSVLHDANPFSASARCVSRTLDTTLTQPFRLFYGSAAPISLEYDSVFAMLEIVGLSVPNFHSYTSGNTDVRCAVKVGGGYSTNNSCLKTACVGGTCSLPQTFSVVNSANHTCTTEDKSVYDIGCNPLADQTTKDMCAKWFSDAFRDHALSTNTFTTHFTFGGADTPIVCTKYPPGGLPGGLNMYANFVCKALLPNGEEVEIYGAEDSGTPIKALQTTAYTTKKDNQVPNLQPVAYYSSESLSANSLISTPTRWQKTNVTAVVTCTDSPGVSDGDTCACAPAVDTSSTTPDLWSPGIPDPTVGADIMRYTRTITSSLNGATVAVRDTAGNISPDARSISIGVDTVAPTVNITTTGTAPSLSVTITATDNTGGSGIWKDNIQTQTYLATAPVPTFDDKCNLTSSDSLLYETYSPTGTPLALTKSTTTPITLNTSTHKLAYCIQDNAGNITKGFYPSVPVSCFSSTNLPTVPGTTPSAVPAIPTYVAPLIARIAPATGVGQFGYGMSTDATNANCFRGIITSNVTRLISNQYNSSTASTVDWSAPAKVKSNPAISNTNGYYYHTAMTPNLLTINTSPSGTGPKVVYAEGADIQINADINYKTSTTTSSDNTLLIIIAKRGTTGANPTGGNIYINPSVKNIDAILITDGAIMNGVNGTPKDYITNPTDLINRLTINGRIYSMNTRGGSIDASILSSNNLGMITTNTGKVFANNAALTTNATPAQAAAQDLERFRVINDDGNTQCTLFLNYKTIPINTLPPILQRPSGYAGGSCGF